MPAPDVIVMVMALSSLTMWRKKYRHSPHTHFLKISFCVHLFTNTELSTCNSMSVTAALQHSLPLSLSLSPAALAPNTTPPPPFVFKSRYGHFVVIVVNDDVEKTQPSHLLLVCTAGFSARGHGLFDLRATC